MCDEIQHSVQLPPAYRAQCCLNYKHMRSIVAYVWGKADTVPVTQDRKRHCLLKTFSLRTASVMAA